MADEMTTTTETAETTQQAEASAAGEAGTETSGIGADTGAEQKEAAKTFTQDDVNKIIGKELARAQKKWEQKIADEKTEAEKLAKMQADERVKYEQKKREDALEAREKAITVRELRAQAYETLAAKDLPKELIDTLNFTDADSCQKSIDAIEKVFRQAVEKSVNERLKGRTPAAGAGTVKTMTRDEIMAIKDDSRRHQEMLKHPEIFGMTK